MAAVVSRYNVRNHLSVHLGHAAVSSEVFLPHARRQSAILLLDNLQLEAYALSQVLCHHSKPMQRKWNAATQISFPVSHPSEAPRRPAVFPSVDGEWHP